MSVSRMSSFTGAMARSRGPRDDSSSSRESSPDNRPSRSSSPLGSDDGDALDDGLPKPDSASLSDRPLIRKPMAFAGATSTDSISTYEAVPVSDPKPGAFLPGQDPTNPSKPKKGGKRPRRTEAYAQQTSRFRLQPYNPNPGSEPPAPKRGRSSASASRATKQKAQPPPYLGGPQNPVMQTIKEHRQHIQRSIKPRPPHGSTFINFYNEDQPPPPPPLSHPVVEQPTTNENGPSVLTILIDDRRSGQKQLAEVWCTVRPATVPDTGFWVNARDLCSQLQKGPSRIDGPAKVSTMRGGYRHYFLRVSDDNADEYDSANLHVLENRTIELQVEEYRRPGGQVNGAPPKQPQATVYRDTASDHPSASHSPLLTPIGEKLPPNVRRIQPYQPHDPPMSVDTERMQQSGRKRLRSPSYESYEVQARRYDPLKSQRQEGLDRSPRSSRHQMHTEHYSHGADRRVPHYHRSPSMESNPSERGRSGAAPTRSHPIQDHLLETDEDSDGDIARRTYLNKIYQIVTKDGEFWQNYYRFASSKKVRDVLECHRLLKKVCDTYGGKSIPGYSQRISKEDILEAVSLKGEGLAAIGEETLILWSYYGENGAREVNADVVALYRDEKPLDYGADPSKALLGLLRKAHLRWDERHRSPGSVGSQGTRSANSDDTQGSRRYATDATYV